MAETNAMTKYIKETRDTSTGGSVFKVKDNAVYDLLSAAEDTMSNSIGVIDNTHKKIHEGEHFYVSGFQRLTDTEEINFYITTPNSSKWAHMLFEIDSIGEMEFYIYEDASSYTGGTTVDPVNNNRNSATVSVLTVVKDPATPATDTGTLIGSHAWGLTDTPRKAGFGGDAARDDEIILKQNSNYIFRLVSNSTGNLTDYKGYWYEKASD
jgi:hypothetical protein